LELCIPLSKALVLGGSIANILVLSLEKHPLNDKRPIIYYEVAAFFEPPGKLFSLIISINWNLFRSNFEHNLSKLVNRINDDLCSNLYDDTCNLERF
jgi:hypothetical protein